jgi:hypothetical protein
LSEQKRPFWGLDSAKATMEDGCDSSTAQHQPMGMFNRNAFRLEVMKKKKELKSWRNGKEYVNLPRKNGRFTDEQGKGITVCCALCRGWHIVMVVWP